MWTRKEVKEKGKVSFKRNYWKALLVALLLSIIAGGSYNSFSKSDPSTFLAVKNDMESDGNHFEMDVDQDAAGNYNVVLDVQDEYGNSVEEETDEKPVEVDLDKNESIELYGTIIGSVLLITTIIFAIVLVFDAFILNPLEMGCNKFFLKNLEDEATLSNVTSGFEKGYMNIVKILLRRDIAIILWSMLFVIPGIIKAYEYRMIPYLLAENPNMTWKEAFTESKTMMTGNKWKAFVLDLSFIGWNLLSILTLGILSIFYVNPYRFSTNAALYEAIKYGYIDTPEVTMA